MPSTTHEILVDMFRTNPSLAAQLITGGLGVQLPAFEEAEVQSNEFTDLSPTEYRADAVVKFKSDGRALFSIVIEAQLRPDEKKRWSWPVYLSTLRARTKCPAVLLVFCIESSTAAWSGKPIDLGHPGWVLTPLTMGPAHVPLVLNAETAKEKPELACLSAIAHSEHPDRDKVLDAYLDALDVLELDRRALYSDFVNNALPAAARKSLEALLITRPYEYRDPFVRKYILQGRAEGHDEGRAEGQALAVLEVLEGRGISIPPHARTRIMECTDPDILRRWLRLVGTVKTIDEMFNGPEQL